MAELKFSMDYDISVYMRMKDANVLLQDLLEKACKENLLSLRRILELHDLNLEVIKERRELKNKLDMLENEIKEIKRENYG